MALHFRDESGLWQNNNNKETETDFPVDLALSGNRGKIPGK